MLPRLLAALFSIALVTSAEAADMATPIAAPAFDWSGVYVGGDVGYLSSRSRYSFTGFPFQTYGTAGVAKFGVHIGYRRQLANNWVFGIEGDLSLLAGGQRDIPLVGAPAVIRTRLRGDVSLRLTGGYAFGRALAYVTAGLSFVDNAGCGAIGGAFPCFPNTGFGGTTAGVTAGAGLAYAVTSNIAVRAEYLYAHYGTRADAAPGFAGTDIGHRLETHTLRVGASYVFATGAN